MEEAPPATGRIKIDEDDSRHLDIVDRLPGRKIVGNDDFILALNQHVDRGPKWTRGDRSCDRPLVMPVEKTRGTMHLPLPYRHRAAPLPAIEMAWKRQHMLLDAAEFRGCVVRDLPAVLARELPRRFGERVDFKTSAWFCADAKRG